MRCDAREHALTQPAQSAGFIPADAWAWWEARRLRYNLGLAAAGWIAYGLNAAIFYAFGHPIWESWRGALGMTLFLGTAFLLMMFIANICYLLGAITESLTAPIERDTFRKRAFGLGFWGSVAAPFIFPLVNLALLIGETG